MGLNIGRQTYGTGIGMPISVSADGAPLMRPIGADVAWPLVDALIQDDIDALTDSRLEDMTPVLVGQQVMRFGKVLVKVRGRAVKTITIDATGGTFTVTVTRTTGADTAARTTGAVAYNASAATLLAALEALANLAVGEVEVTKASDVFTVTFLLDENPTMTTGVGSLTGGASTAAVALVENETDYVDQWAPYDADKEARNYISREAVGILNYTLRYLDPVDGTVNPEVQLIGLIEGGLVYKERIECDGAGQATWTQLLTAMPQLRSVPAE